MSSQSDSFRPPIGAGGPGTVGPFSDPNVSRIEDQHGSRPQAYSYRLSAEENRVLKDCGRESFWYRSVPFTVFNMVGVTLLRNAGWIKPHPRFGMWIVNSSAIFIGYFVGKLSYIRTCKEKLMQLPNSRVAEALRAGKSARSLEVMQEMTRPELPSLPDFRRDDSHMNVPGQMQFPGSQSSYSGGDAFSYAQDGLAPEKAGNLDNSPPQPQSTTYEELRAKNRQEQAPRLRPYTMPQPGAMPPNIPPQRPDGDIRSSSSYDESNADSNTFGAPTFDNRPSSSQKGSGWLIGSAKQPMSGRDKFGDAGFN